jgi:hypothetical protein
MIQNLIKLIYSTKHFVRFIIFFNIIVLLHFAEHIAQVVQLYLLHWERSHCLGILGIPFPWLIHSEWLHYLYSLFMLVGVWLIYLSKYSNNWWYITLILAFYHHFEHAQLLEQAIAGVNFFDAPHPVSLFQAAIGAERIELHFFYNLIVLIPMIVAIKKSMFNINTDKF